MVFVLLLSTVSCSSNIQKLFFKSDSDIANAHFEQLLDAMGNQNDAAIKELFAQTAISRSETFDEDVGRLFEFFKGDFKSYYDWGGVAAESGFNDDGSGRNWKKIQSTYDVETTEGKYRFAIEEFVTDTADSNNVGIHSLYIINGEDSNMQVAYNGDGKYTPGINFNKEYIPDNVFN